MSFRNKAAITVGAVFAAAVALACTARFSHGAPQRIAGNIIMPVQKLASRVLTPAAKLRDRLVLAGGLAEENERLRAENNALRAENRGSEEYIKENERLRALLRLEETMVGQSVLAARVLSVDFDNFSQTVVINRGSEDGVAVDNTVTSAAGVVGRVSEVGRGWARVTTLLSPKNSMGVRITRTGDVAVAEGDLSMAKKNTLRLSYISGSAQLIEGDTVETSGLGGIYPPGLFAGRISEIKKDNSGPVEYAVIEPGADFSRLYEVLVITAGERGSIAPEVVAEKQTEDNTAAEPDSTEEFDPADAIG